METADAVIAGAGIIGLSLALDLAAHGLRVIVLERGQAMNEASWAAAGMLAAHDPDNPAQIRELAELSLRLYPAYLETVERLSARRVPIRAHSALQAIHPDPVRESPRTLTSAEVRNLVPGINPGHLESLLLDEPSLDPRDLCAALPLAAQGAGVELREKTPVVSIDTGADKQVIVQTPANPIAAAHFVNCAGAWADFPALSLSTDRPLGVTPCKGQITTVRLRGPGALTHVLRTPGIYLVPRGDGRITIGATAEHSGFDKTVEPAAIARLLAAAAALWPPIADAEILESWAGLRPASNDQLPLLGPLMNQNGAHPNRWVATGHFRNGILLAPATARVLSQAIRGQAREIDLAPFDPARIPLKNAAEIPIPSPA